MENLRSKYCVCCAKRLDSVKDIRIVRKPEVIAKLNAAKDVILEKLKKTNNGE